MTRERMEPGHHQLYSMDFWNIPILAPVGRARIISSLSIAMNACTSAQYKNVSQLTLSS